MASVPVPHALLLVVAWPPSPSKPLTHAVAQLAMTLSIALLPRRRTRPAFVSGTTNSPAVSIPPSEVPMMAAVFQSTGEFNGGRLKPASRQHSPDAMIAYRMAVFVVL